MECDDLIDELLAADSPEPNIDAGNTYSEAIGDCSVGTAASSAAESVAVACDRKRERLAALAAGGHAKQYTGKTISADQIDSMSDAEIERLYARYEARLGAAMTKTLGQAVLQLYSGMAGMLLPIPEENRPKLVADLEEDPFVGHALSSATCELYHRYGLYLAPLTAALTTAKYCRFGQHKPRSYSDESDDVGRAATGDRQSDFAYASSSGANESTDRRHD